MMIDLHKIQQASKKKRLLFMPSTDNPPSTIVYNSPHVETELPKAHVAYEKSHKTLWQTVPHSSFNPHPLTRSYSGQIFQSSKRSPWIYIVIAMGLFAVLLVMIVYGIFHLIQKSDPRLIRRGPKARISVIKDEPFGQKAPMNGLLSFPRGGALSVKVTAEKDVWIRATIDSEILFEGILYRGMTEEWLGQENIIVKTGNPNSINVFVNGGRLDVPYQAESRPLVIKINQTGTTFI